jgi:hypothetical protein
MVRAVRCQMHREPRFGQRQGLGWAPRVHQQARVVALIALGKRMLGANCLFADLNRSAEKRLGFFRLPGLS